MSYNLKPCDLLEFSKIYAVEYNMPEFHDRVLVLDVMRNGWERNTVLTKASDKTDDYSVENDDVQSKTSESHSSSNEDFLEDENTSDDEARPSKIPRLDGEQSRDDLLSKSETRPEPGGILTVPSKTDAEVISFAQTIPVDSDKKAPSFSISATETVTEAPNNLLRQHKIFVHSSFLAVQSKYFRSLFLSGMKETNSKEVHFKVSQFEEKAHLTLIEAIYKADILNDASVDELLAVLELADKYDLRFVFRKCKYVLQENVTTFEISKRIIHVIKEKHDMMDVEDLAATLQEVLVEHFSPLDNNWQFESFSSLSEPSVMYLLSSDDLITQSENTVFHALMFWMECNDANLSRLTPTSKLLTAVRFKLVTIDYLYNVIKNHPIATKMPFFQELYLSGMTYHAIPLKQKELLAEKPVLREKPTDTIAQYSWLFQKKTLQAAMKTDTPLQSEVFWCCGYRMRLDLEVESKWDINATLNILDLNSESLLPLEWTIGFTSHPGKNMRNQNSFTLLTSYHTVLWRLYSTDIPELDFIGIYVKLK